MQPLHRLGWNAHKDGAFPAAAGPHRWMCQGLSIACLQFMLICVHLMVDSLAAQEYAVKRAADMTTPGPSCDKMYGQQSSMLLPWHIQAITCVLLGLRDAQDRLLWRDKTCLART